VAAGQPKKLLGRQEIHTYDALFTTDGQTVVSADIEGDVRLWDVASGRLVGHLDGHTAVARLALTADGKTLATASHDLTVKLWDIATRRLLRTLRGHTLPIERVAFSPDGKLLATVSGDFQRQKTPGEVKLWDVASGAELVSFTGHRGPVHGVAFAPEGQTLASASADGTVLFWDVSRWAAPAPVPSRPEATLLVHPGPAVTNYVAFARDGRTLIVANEDGTIQLWYWAKHKMRSQWKGPALKVMDLALSPDGRTVAVAAGVWDRPALGGEVGVWGCETGKPIASYREPHSALVSVAFAPGGRTLAVGAFSGAVRLVDATTGRVRTTLQGPGTGSKNALAFTADGETLLGAGGKPAGRGRWVGLIQLWDLKTGKERDSWSGSMAAEVQCLRLSPDGRTVAVGCRDHTVRLWDMADGRERAVLEGHAAWVHSLAFSAGGKVLASGTLDGVVKLWDVAAARDLATLSGVMEVVMSVAITPDGGTLAVGGGGWKQPGRVELWDVTGIPGLVVQR
jgi:WD40 repeat protein